MASSSGSSSKLAADNDAVATGYMKSTGAGSQLHGATVKPKGVQDTEQSAHVLWGGLDESSYSETSGSSTFSEPFRRFQEKFIPNGVDLISASEEESSDGIPQEREELEDGIVVDSDGEPTSIGSTGHPHSCKPCFLAVHATCISGINCLFCHRSHEEIRNRVSYLKKPGQAAPKESNEAEESKEKQKSRQRPCKGQRIRFRKHVSRLEEVVKTNMAEGMAFEPKAIELPPSIDSNPQLRAKALKRLKKKAISLTVGENGQEYLVPARPPVPKKPDSHARRQAAAEKAAIQNRHVIAQQAALARQAYAAAGLTRAGSAKIRSATQVRSAPDISTAAGSAHVRSASATAAPKASASSFVDVVPTVTFATGSSPAAPISTSRHEELLTDTIHRRAHGNAFTALDNSSCAGVASAAALDGSAPKAVLDSSSSAGVEPKASSNNASGAGAPKPSLSL